MTVIIYMSGDFTCHNNAKSVQHPKPFCGDPFWESLQMVHLQMACQPEVDTIWVRTSQRKCSFAHRTGRQLIVQEGKHYIDVQIVYIYIYEASNATQHCAVSGFSPESNGNWNYALNQMEIEIMPWIKWKLKSSSFQPKMTVIIYMSWDFTCHNNAKSVQHPKPFCGAPFWESLHHCWKQTKPFFTLP